MKKITFVIDLDRCIGCRACQISCKQENGVALGACRNEVKQIGPIGTYPDIQMYFLPAMCQHCENPACAEVCPTGACYKDPSDGVVRIDRDVCIGCRTCEGACPYKVNTFNAELRVMDKCNICEQLRKAGETPACVKNCAGRALHVGDINDPDSEVSKLLKNAGKENVYTLRDFGNKPGVRYILRRDKWIDVLPQDSEKTKGVAKF